MTIDVLFGRAPMAVHELRSAVEGLQVLTPFSEEAREFCSALSRDLFRFPTADAPTKALGFWLRPSNIRRLSDSFDTIPPDAIRVPRGIVFHVAPSNVDTIFVYSWVLSLLSGNANVVRVSPRSLDQIRPLLERVASVLASPAFSSVRRSTLIVSYDRKQEVSQMLSAAADVRVVWGGDATVSSFRTLPLSPRAVELNFPDRTSLSAIRATSFLNLDGEGRVELVRKFFNDSYWFDQLACSSPRNVLWVGEPHVATQASTVFRDLLTARIQEENYRVGGAEAVAKLVYSARGVLDGHVSAVARPVNELFVLGTDGPRPGEQGHPIASGDFPGGGLFFESFADSLTGCARFLDRRTQTLTVFGFSAEEIRDLIRAAGHLSVDRVVEVGSALAFGNIWDGQDFFASFTRLVSAPASKGPVP